MTATTDRLRALRAEHPDIAINVYTMEIADRLSCGIGFASMVQEQMEEDGIDWSESSIRWINAAMDEAAEAVKAGSRMKIVGEVVA